MWSPPHEAAQRELEGPRRSDRTVRVLRSRDGKELFRCPPCARFLSILFELLGSREADMSHFLGLAQGAGIQGHPWENSAFLH